MSGAETDSSSKQPVSWDAFWPRYVLAHQRLGTQWLHVTGTLVGLALLVTAIASDRYWLLPAGLAAGYAFAWVGHSFVEHNKPATFGHPFLSFVSDFRMAYCIVTGRMAGEVRRARERLDR